MACNVKPEAGRFAQNAAKPCATPIPQANGVGLRVSVLGFVWLKKSSRPTQNKRALNPCGLRFKPQTLYPPSFDSEALNFRGLDSESPSSLVP